MAKIKIGKMGKKAYREYKTTPKWKDIKTDKLPALPTLDADHPYGHGSMCTYDMNGNDKRGDCVVAGSLNTQKLFNATVGVAVVWNDNSWETAYEKFCGWDPNNPDSTDNGCEIQAVLNGVQSTGLVDADGEVHKIDGFVALDQTNVDEIYEGVYYFDTVKIGLQLPNSAVTQFNAGQPWTLATDDGGIAGGHDVEIEQVIMDSNGKIWFMVATWGVLQKMELPFFNKYCDESDTEISKEMLTNKGFDIDGVDWTTLETYMTEITNNPTPPAPATTDATYLTTDPASGVTGSKIQLKTTLIDTVNNKPVPNEEIGFMVNSEGLGTAKTNSKGLAVLDYKITENAGTYPIINTFQTDSNYTGTTGNNDLTVTDTPTPCNAIIAFLEHLEGEIEQVINEIEHANGSEKKKAKRRLEKLLDKSKSVREGENA